MKTFDENHVEIAQRVARQFLPNTPREVRLDTNDTVNDTLVIGDYSIYATASGKYLVEVYVPSPYRYNEPPDGDVIAVTTTSTFYDALSEVVAHRSKYDVHDFIMGTFMPER